MDDVRKRDGSAAQVTIQAVPPTPRRSRSREVIIAEQQGRIETLQDRSVGEDGAAVTTTHTRPGTKVMYKPLGKRGYEPRNVSSSAVGVLLAEGWYEYCPMCQNEHLDKNGAASTDPNLCAARDPLAVRVCPVCDKRIYDNVQFSETAEDDGSDPNVIREEGYSQSTPESRTKASLDLHLWVKHPRQAQMMGVPALPGVVLAEVFGEAKQG